MFALQNIDGIFKKKPKKKRTKKTKRLSFLLNEIKKTKKEIKKLKEKQEKLNENFYTVMAIAAVTGNGKKLLKNIVTEKKQINLALKNKRQKLTKKIEEAKKNTDLQKRK